VILLLLFFVLMMKEEIEIEAQVLRIGKTLASVAVDMRIKATGKIIVQGRHTKFIGGAPLSKL
jgi:acyl-coenzyme A thioesterase PaaI-like protein